MKQFLLTALIFISMREIAHAKKCDMFALDNNDTFSRMRDIDHRYLGDNYQGVDDCIRRNAEHIPTFATYVCDKAIEENQRRGRPYSRDIWFSLHFYSNFRGYIAGSGISYDLGKIFRINCKYHASPSL